MAAPQHHDARRTARHLRRLLERWGCERGEFNGEPDHVHPLLRLHPAVKPSSLVNNLKTVSSRLLRRDHGKELRRHFRRPVLWSRSCCLVSSGGAPLEVLRARIENQAGADYGPLAALRRPPGSRSGRAHCATIRVARRPSFPRRAHPCSVSPGAAQRSCRPPCVEPCVPPNKPTLASAEASWRGLRNERSGLFTARQMRAR